MCLIYYFCLIPMGRTHTHILKISTAQLKGFKILKYLAMTIYSLGSAFILYTVY